MKRILTSSEVKKFKLCMVIFSIWFLGALVQSAVAQSDIYSWKGETFSIFNRETFSQGEIVEYSNKEALCSR